ncbi:hypothetical protein ACRYCC_02755 [Actinomadura scrupuli]|uniref:hypothetical protein n=1 Tax=Actinomadura scrupuli TaxID=559629 RepID=UPI003D96251F
MLRRLLPALLCAAVLCGGCSGDATPPVADVRSTEPAVPPAITAPESLKVLDDYVTGHNGAAASGELKAWRDTATGPLREVLSAQATAGHGRPKSGRISLVNPVMYVPRLTGYPRWFAAAALEEHPGGGAPVEVVLLFVRATAAERWRPAHRLPFKGRPPEIATDGQGYALPVAPQAAGFVLAPGGLPAAHAAYLNGRTSPAFAPDPYTASQRAPLPAAGGWSRTDAFTPGGAPVYALRTKDGGALVWYTVTQATRLTSDGSGSAATLPAAVRAYLGGGEGGGEGGAEKAVGRAEATWMWLAIGYLPTRGRAAVLGENVTLTRATAAP